MTSCAIALDGGRGRVRGMKWYFVEQGLRVGPVERETLEERIREGVVQADTLVWCPGMTEWKAACLISELEVPPPLPGMPPPLPMAAAGESPAPGPAQVESGLRDWAEREAAARAKGDEAARVARAEARFGGFWMRFVAKLIDGLLLLGVGLLLAEAVTSLFYEGMLPMPPDWRGFLRAQGVLSLINAAVAVGFSVFFIRTYEATPGKRMLGLRVVRADGGRVGAGRIILRYLGEQLSGILFMVGYVMAAFDDEKRTLHDYLCDTRVVKGVRRDTDTQA